jgi:hypothetical protein
MGKSKAMPKNTFLLENVATVSSLRVTDEQLMESERERGNSVFRFKHFE